MSDQAAAINVINPSQLAPPPGYAQVVDVRAERIVFIAGQTSSDATGRVIGKGDFAAQATQVFQNLATALDAVGCTARSLVKLTVFVRDMGRLTAYREARDRFFATCEPPAMPAITLVEVSRLFDEDFLIEIEAIAAA